AERAKEVHLVNRVVPRDQLMATVEEMASKILHARRRGRWARRRTGTGRLRAGDRHTRWTRYAP
ncbi:hypothetical protein AB0L40_27645, partial [Patulibacter sp. NPDC049589]